MSTIQTETLYKKVGRRYITVNEGIDRHDLKVPVGGSVLIVSTGPGCHTYQYNVDPDRAAFLAAATLFRDAMVSAIQEIPGLCRAQGGSESALRPLGHRLNN